MLCGKSLTVKYFTCAKRSLAACGRFHKKFVSLCFECFKGNFAENQNLDHEV